MDAQRTPPSYFDRLASSCFGLDECGNTLFFRVGPLSQPYVITNDHTESALRVLGAQFYRRMVVGSALLFLLFPLLPLYWAFVVYSFASSTRTLVAGLPRGTKRLTLLNALQTRSMAYSNLSLAFATAASALLLCASSYFLFLLSGHPDYQFAAGLVAILGASLTIASSLIWRYRTVH